MGRKLLLRPMLMPRSQLRLMSTLSLLLPLLWLLQFLPTLLLPSQLLTLPPPLPPPPTLLPPLSPPPTPMPQLPTPDTTSVMPLLPTPTTLDSLSLPLPRLNKPLVQLVPYDIGFPSDFVIS